MILSSIFVVCEDSKTAGLRNVVLLISMYNMHTHAHAHLHNNESSIVLIDNHFSMQLALLVKWSSWYAMYNMHTHAHAHLHNNESSIVLIDNHFSMQLALLVKWSSWYALQQLSQSFLSYAVSSSSPYMREFDATDGSFVLSSCQEQLEFNWIFVGCCLMVHFWKSLDVISGL